MNTDRAVAQQPRVGSIDAYRGFVMLLMMAEVLRFCSVSEALPDSRLFRLLCYHQSHVQWVGCSLHDLIQPSFTFLVGVVLPFSVAGRRARGQTTGAMARHALVRSLVLVLIGLLLTGIHGAWDLSDTLAQIGLGYGAAFALSLRPPRDGWVVLAGILAGYWAAFALYPLAGAGFDYARVGVSQAWLAEHGQTSFAAHWQKGSNLAAAFDRWLLNLVPRRDPFVALPNGISTLNFVPTVATMILGIAAGRVLRSERSPWARARWCIAAGVLGLSGGWALGALGVCPVVKSIWTPAWVLFSGGACFLLLAAFYAAVDIRGWSRPLFPLIVIGVNSMAAYCLAYLYPALAFNALRRLTGPQPFRVLGGAYEDLLYGSVILLGYWLFLFVLYRRRIFVRI